jgi:hypothetical protein
MKIQPTLHISIALLKFRVGNTYDDKNSLRGWKSPKAKRFITVQGSVALYTMSADFDGGSSINVNHNAVQDQLQLDNSSKPFNFIWVPCSSRGTVVKVDTLTGAILGEYRSGPRNRSMRDPSRTTVDKDGSVWLSNRENIGPHGHGTIVHIGLAENNQCKDCNGIPGIQTSTGVGNSTNTNLKE